MRILITYLYLLATTTCFGQVVVTNSNPNLFVPANCVVNLGTITITEVEENDFNELATAVSYEINLPSGFEFTNYVNQGNGAISGLSIAYSSTGTSAFNIIDLNQQFINYIKTNTL